MKQYAKQINPEYQESPFWFFYDENSEIYENLFIIPTRNCKGLREDKIQSICNAVLNAADEYDSMGGGWHCNYDTLTECVNDLLPREDGKPYNTRQVHKWKEILTSFEGSENDCVCEVLELMCGGKWENTAIRGCCQGDYAEVIYKADEYDKASIDYLETEYFNTGTEWMIHDEDSEPESAEDVSGYTTYCYGCNSYEIRKELAEQIGCNLDELVIFEYSGCEYTDVYTVA